MTQPPSDHCQGLQVTTLVSQLQACEALGQPEAVWKAQSLGDVKAAYGEPAVCASPNELFHRLDHLRKALHKRNKAQKRSFGELYQPCIMHADAKLHQGIYKLPSNIL